MVCRWCIWTPNGTDIILCPECYEEALDDLKKRE